MGPVNGGSEAEAISASDPKLQALSEAVAKLKELDLEGLRKHWRKLHRSPAPEHLPRWLLLRIIAYRIQANALGDLDRETVKFLEQVAAAREARRAAGIKLGKKPPPVPAVAERRSLKPGTVLVREHGKVLHHVMVVKDGFSWNGATYASLSEVAKAITGTNWNGPRFFGLRAKSERGRPAVRGGEDSHA
jgi:hypothetical protein